MMTTNMISEGKDITSKMDKETAMLGSHEGLGSLAMLHNECRHTAAHLRNTDKEPTIIMDSQETAELKLMTISASEDQTPVGNMTSQSAQHVHGVDEQRDAVGRGMELTRTKYTAYATPQLPAGLADPNREGRETLLL